MGTRFKLVPRRTHSLPTQAFLTIAAEVDLRRDAGGRIPLQAEVSLGAVAGGLHVGEMCTNQSRFGDAGWHDPGGLTARRKDPLVGCSAKMKAVRWSPATWDSFTA